MVYDNKYLYLMDVYWKSMIKTPINFTEEQYTQLKEESKKLGSSMASIIRLALNQYFKEKENG